MLTPLRTGRHAVLFHLPLGVPFEYVASDVCRDDLTSVVADVNAVIHLAGTTSTQDEEELHRINVVGTHRVGSACAATGVRLIFLSSLSVRLGTGGVDPADERFVPDTAYARSKLNAERVLAELVCSAGLRVVVCRLGTVYGPSPGMRFHTAVNKFVLQACLGQPLTVWRTALDQYRPYLHVNDAVRILRFVLGRAGDRDPHEVFEVATESARVRDIIAILEGFFPLLRMECVNSPLMNDRSLTVHCDRLARLEFEFKGSLASGIGDTIEWLRGLSGHRLPVSGDPGSPLESREVNYGPVRR